MKTSLKISIVLMTIVALWSVCQFDLMNSLLSFISLSILIFAYAIFTAEKINDDND